MLMRPEVQVFLFLLFVLPILFLIYKMVQKKTACVPTKKIYKAIKYDENCKAIECEKGYYLDNGYCLSEVGFHECNEKVNNCDVGEICVKSSCVPCGDIGEACLNGLCCEKDAVCKSGVCSMNTSR